MEKGILHLHYSQKTFDIKIILLPQGINLDLLRKALWSLITGFFCNRTLHKIMIVDFY